MSFVVALFESLFHNRVTMTNCVECMGKIRVDYRKTVDKRNRLFSVNALEDIIKQHLRKIQRKNVE
jgi:hypothetical protein